MAFTPDKLKTARDSGYTDDEIWDFLGKDDQRFNLAKENGYSLDETITTFSSVNPAQTAEPEPDQPFFAVEDVVSAIGTIPEALSVGVPAAFQKLVTGTAMPEESEAMEKDLAFQERMRQEQQDRQAAGKSSMVGEAIREAAPSIAFSFGGLGAGIAGAIGGTAIGGPVGATVGGMAASGTASYRMAAADLLYRSFKALEEQKGSPLTEDEKAQAYKEFLPLAQNSALWEAGPEAVSNAVLLGAGKFVFGFGKPLARKLVGESIERVNKGIASKVAAGTGAVAAELGTETITALGQFAPEMAAQKYTRTGTTEGAPTEYPGGAMQAFKDVAPATLALTGMMAGAGGVVKAATLPFQKAKTPEQIEEDNINLDADREADNLLIPDNDTESKSIKSQIDTERADLAIKKELYNTLPDGDKTKAVLATEIKEYEGRITGLDNTLRQRLGLSLPITTAEQQQIELAKQIARKPAQLGAMPSPAAQTAEATYGAATGVYDVFAGARRKPVEVTPTIKESLPVAEEAIISVDKTESFNQELEQKKDFNPPALPSLQDARSVPDKVAKKGNTLSISGGSQESIILNNEKAKKKFDAIGYDRQEIALPDDINEKVSSRYGASIAKIKSIYSPTWLGAHFHGGIAVSKDVEGTQRGRIVAHELGHASHSLLGDQINKDQEVLNELGKIEQILYPGLREKIQSSRNPDTRFFNYLLSADELIAEFNVERITNPEQAAQVAPKLTSLLESVEKDKRLVADRKSFPVILGAIRETKERLKVKGLEPRQIKAGTMDVLAGKYKQWSKTAKFVIDRAKSGELELAKLGLENLKIVNKATKEFVKRTAELSGSPELMDYFNELYPEAAPAITPTPVAETPAVTPAVTVETDPARRQEIQNSIAEGEGILKSGRNIAGRKLTNPELDMVRRSVDSSRAKLGDTAPAAEVAPDKTITMQEASDRGYTQRDPSSIRRFKADKITTDSLTKHLEKNGFQDGDVIETSQGTAEIYVADTVFAYSWKPKKGNGRDGIIKDPVGGVKINPVVMRDPNAPSLSVKVEKTSAPKGYVKKGDKYIFEAGVTEQPVGAGISPAEAAKVTAPVSTPAVSEAPAAEVAPAAKIESVGENKIYSPVETSQQDTGAYHFGDGGIASDTTMQRMGAGRGTGHYGTGTYFLGSKEADVQRADRPMLNINLAGLNMAKPGRSAIRLHDTLRLFNKSILQGEAIKFDQPADNGNRIFDLLDIALIGQVSGDRKARIKDAMTKVEGVFKSGTDDKLRTPSTYLMQELGFDGIDVRGTEADNTTYGSVVFAKPVLETTPTTSAAQAAVSIAPEPTGSSELIAGKGLPISRQKTKDQEYIQLIKNPQKNISKIQATLEEESAKAGYQNLWHTSKSKFDNFDMRKATHIGHHFGTKEQADSIKSNIDKRGKSESFISKYAVKLKNPLRVLDGGASIHPTFLEGGQSRGWGVVVADALESAGIKEAAQKVRNIEGEYRNAGLYSLYETEVSEKIRNVLLESGIDSLVYKNESEGKTATDSVIILKPDNIKSLDSIVMDDAGNVILPKDRFAPVSPTPAPTPAAPIPAVSEAPASEPEGKAVTPAQEDVKVSRYRKFLGESAPQAISEAKNALSTFKTTMLGKRGDSPFQAEPRLRELKNVISLFVANRLNVTNQNADQIAEQIILGKPNIVDKVTELKPIKAKELDDIGANRSAIMRFGYELDDKKTYRHPREAEVIAATPASEPAGISRKRKGEAGGVLIPSREDFIQAGQNIYEAGMEFGAWAKQMIQRFGDVVREFLGDVWEAVSGFPAKLEEMAGYLPGKGERGAVTFGRGEEPPKKPAEPAPEKPAEEKPTEPAEPKERGTIARMAITAYKTTPKGILAKTTKIIKDSVFDGDSEVSDSATKRAWNLISSLVATNDKSVANAEAINQLTREAMTEVKAPEGATTEEAKTFEVVKQTVGMPKLRNELFNYAIKLKGQGDSRMLEFLLNNELNLAGNSIKTKEDIGRFLGALRGISSYIITATEAEQAGFFNIAAQQFFDTKNPTDEQVQQIKDIFNKVKEVKIDQEKELMTELEEVGKAAGVDLPAAVDKQLENTPGLDPMVVAITNMLKMGGTFTYRPTKNKIGEAVRNTISRGITNYRKKIVSKAANGLETGFWKTLSSTENKPGPLGELDSAQNQALGNIVKQALVKMGLQGTPPNTKMSIYEQVASILGEQPLSQDKIKMADEKIRGGIEAKRQAELENATEDQQEAINLKYDEMTIAWDDAMSRSLDMPVSDTMLRRMILNELKEADTSIQDIAKLMEEEPVIGASRQDRLVNSIIEKVTGITFEGQLTRDYTNLKSYLSSILENMVLARQQKNKAAKAVAKTKRDASGDPDKQAQAQIDRLAKIQADPTIFGEKRIDLVRNAVRDALSLQLNIGFTPEQSAKIKAGWKGAFVADPNKKGIPTSFMLELQRLGVSEAAANTLADIVWRQIEVNAMSRQIDATTKAVEAGPIGGIVQAILDTPLANQQDPNWRKNVILDYLKNAGVKPSQAENIAKLFDVSLRKRFAKAQEEAAIKAAKSIKGGLTTNSSRALEKFLKAIRAQVLDPGKDVAKAFAEEMGWKGFTKDQIVKLNELDAIVNDNERTDAEIAVATEQIQKIIDKVSMPPQVKEVLASFYIGNALMRFPTFAVQAFDPLAMTTFNTAIESFRNITNPQQFIQTWANYGRAISNLARETAFSYKNDILRSGRMIDYLDNQDRKIKRLADESVRKFKAGDIRGAMKDGIIGYTAWTFRTLKALDDGAYSLLTSTTLPQYVEAALKNAKIPREKRRGVMRQILEAREMDIKRMVADGVSKNDAVIYANERMQAAITKELSGLNIDAQEVINSAINDALARIGKTRFAEDILSGKVEEIKDLGTISAPFLRWYESVSKSVSGSGSESQKIFYRILLGFPLIPARIFNIAAGYTPLTIYRHAMQAWKGRYQLTYGTALQRRQRLAEQLAGTMVLLPLLALRSNSTDEEDEKEKGFGVYITGQGPSKMKDKTLHAKWNDRHDPFSLEFRMGGKTKFSIDAKAAGPLSVMIYLLGAMDDWETNRRLDGLKTSKDDWKEAQDKASIFTSLYELGGYAVLTTARRGPTTGVMQGLVDFRRFPDDPIAAIGADVSFSAMPAVPILGTGIAKNLSDFFSQPIENTTKEGAILSNIPIVGPIAGKAALNSYGQRLGELRVSEKLKKSFGVPFTLVVSDNEEDNKLTSLTLKFGDGPTPLRREDVENELRAAISDDEWYLAAKTFGDRNRIYVLKNYNRYEKMKPAGFSKVMSALGKVSKANAIAAVKKARRNNP